MVNLTEHKSKIVASFLTFLVIGLLIMAGPAEAFSVSLGAFSDDNAKQGDLISAQFDLNMNSNERVEVDAIVLSSDLGLNCAVDVDGNPLPMYDCEGIQIEKLSSSNASYGYDYSYGYGYGYGYAGSSSKLSYNVTLNTSILAIGENQLTLTANSESVSKTILVSSQGDVETVTTLVLGGDFTFFESEELNASINITFEDGSTGSGSITVEQYSEKPANVGSFSLPGLNTYLVINDDNLGSALSNETELRFYYTDAEVEAAGIVESTLKLYYWNATSNAWESPLSTGVNTVDNYVSAKTNHFSSWGMFGNSPSTTTSTSSGGSSTNDYDGSITHVNYSIPDQPVAGNVNANGLTSNESQDASRTSLFTGAVTGALGSKGLWAVIIFIVIVGGAYLIVRRKRKNVIVSPIESVKVSKKKSKRKK
jgi:hypothetical protein